MIGELTFRKYGLPEVCSTTIGTTGTLESGSGEVLGTIKIVGVLSAKSGERRIGNMRYIGSSTCIVNLEAREIDLGVNVLVVDFKMIHDSPRLSGHWILNKSEFSDGEINLEAPRYVDPFGY